MCGIMGFLGKPKSEESNQLSFQLASSLLKKTVTRGNHATGCYVLFDQGDKARRCCYKLDVPSPTFVHTQDWKDLWKAGKMPYHCLGHCRYYTHGDPKKQINNHPHVSDKSKIALVHNGVIRSYETLKNSYPCRSECDSEVILRIIESEGAKSHEEIKKGIEKLFKHVSGSSFGSMSCLFSFFDTVTRIDHFYAFRNDGNPMVMVDLRDTLGQIFFASTKEILEEAIKESAMPAEIRDKKIEVVPSFKLHHFTSESLTPEVTDLDEGKTTTTTTTVGTGGPSYYRQGYPVSTAGNFNHSVRTNTAEDSNEDPDLVDEDPSIVTTEAEVTDLLNELSNGICEMRKLLWNIPMGKRDAVIPSVKKTLEYHVGALNNLKSYIKNDTDKVGDQEEYD